ncbi:MAG: GGDEF domain-containing protein [Burkholderiales bacterium]|nr:GGDEF domain-containing protein [Burkholderiales bacterium]
MPADPSTQPAVAVLAKGALRRLAQAHLEPTPENYARAFAEEAGAANPRPKPAPSTAGWPAIVERLVRNLERGGRQWTAARRKESLYRVLDSSRSDEERLAQRLRSLLQAWESDRAQDGLEPVEPAATAEPQAVHDEARETARGTAHERTAHEAAHATAHEAGHEVGHEGVREPAHEAVHASAHDRAHDLAHAPAHDPVHESPRAAVRDAAPGVAVRALNDAVCAGLGDADARAVALAQRLRGLADECVSPAPTADSAPALAEACGEAGQWFGQRHELLRQVKALCAEMSQGLVELSEDESWSRGQCEALRLQLSEAVDVRAVRAASAMLADTRVRQASAKREREAARTALKQLLAGMIGEVGALQQQAGGFESAIARHASAVEAADSLEGLATVVQSMLADSRQLRSAIGASHERLQHDSARATALEARVRDLEAELRRLSDEASTDALTQVANRRGLEQNFGEASARASAAGRPLAVGLLDIDNFKKLNDRLGHAAGDTALKALAAEVRKRLRPEDLVARFGGEEFVVLLPGQPVAQAQQALTRLQRSLSASLFLHEGEEVFVTFSAGVTAWRPGETLEAAVERADGGLYEAKRSGKNRTCAV